MPKQTYYLLFSMLTYDFRYLRQSRKKGKFLATNITTYYLLDHLLTYLVLSLQALPT